MRAMSPEAVAVLSGPRLALAQLVYLDFPGGGIALNTSNADLVWDGITYKGAGALGEVSAVDDSPGEIRGLQFSLSGVSSEYLAMALDASNTVPGTPVFIRTAILDEDLQIVDAPLDWQGRLDTMSVEENGETCTIQVTAESTAVDLLRGAALTYSDADQKSLYPGDRAFELTASQIDTPVVWPSAAWLAALGPNG